MHLVKFESVNNYVGSYVELLARRAAEQPDDLAYAFLADGVETARLTFAELDRRARALGALIADRGGTGERVLLLYPPGLDYIVAFYGCLCAGAVAVPAYPPRMNRNLPRLEAVVEDARPSLALATTAITAQVDGWRERAPALAAPRWTATDLVDLGDAEGWRPPAAGPETLAFLQYTSGSTSSPKGVMVSHGNLLHNQAMMADRLGHDADTVIVSWLPLYHDMGLIGNVLASLYNGGPCVVMAAVDFLKSPVRWLEAVSRYRATFSGGPDFAYGRCVDRVRPEELERLDLSSWKAAFNGSEPVREATLERFARAFAGCGFRREALFPCYGLAEATLFAAGRFFTEPTAEFSRAGLATHRALPAHTADDAEPLVSCGVGGLDSRIAVVDPDSGGELPEGVVGEIWLASPSVAQGYWRRPAASAETFGGRLAGGEGPFLRTGDLGFVYRDELYVTGRHKDLIILRGHNHYPHDLEATVEKSHPALRPGYVAAFALAAGGGERLAVVAEVEREQRHDLDVEGVVASVRRELRAEHGVDAAAVVLIRPGTLPKTSSGKTQRRAARDALVAGELAVLGEWRSDELTAAAGPATAGRARLEEWLLARLAAKLDLAPAAIDVGRPVAAHGLDSVVAIDLIRDIEVELGVPFPVERLFQGEPTLAEVATALAAAGATVGAPPAAAGGEPADDDEAAAPATATPPPAAPVHRFRHYVNPEIGRLLAQMGADKEFVRGEGCWLWDRQGNRYLDFLAQYGALPFGFNPPEIWAALERARRRGEPSLVQPSALVAAGELAERLIAVAPPGLRYVTFANSGAEAVEAAIKLCRSTTGRHGILAARNSFHGKTLGALSATDKRKYQEPFGAPVPGFHFVPYGDLAALADALATRAYAGFLVEPIQGEGGIVEPPPGYLRQARELCRKHGTLFVADEVQTGLGRTGTLFACDEEGVTPDVMTLAKALGGGLLPIGACLATAEAYNEDFALNHTSTFAGNALACRAALATLDLLAADDGALVARVAEHGGGLKRALLALRERFPDLVREVRGRGYMLGVRFGLDRHTGGGRIVGYLGEGEALTALVVGHLLAFEGVRVGYTLNQGGVLRIEPPLVAGWEECRVFLAAFERLLERMATRDAAVLTAHLTGFDPAAARPPAAEAPAAPRRPRRLARPRHERFAFIVHPLSLADYAALDGSLAVLSRAQVQRLATCLADNFDPFVIGETTIASPTGASAYGEFILVPRLARELLAMPYHHAVAEVRLAAHLAARRGARLIGLGAYLSVVTQSGLSLKGDGLPALTTGNSYTAVAGRQALVAAARLRGRDLASSTVAVLGAAGSIGRAISLLLAGEAGRLILLGNPRHRAASLRRLAEIAREIVRSAWSRADRGETLAAGSLGAEALAFRARRAGGTDAGGAPAAADEFLAASGAVRGSCDADALLPEADFVVTATNAVGSLVKPHHLKRDAVVCDISRPTNVDRAVRATRPDVTVVDGGVVRLPGGADLGFNASLGDGLAYACMAETMMLTLEQRFTDASLGFNLGLDQLAEIERIAARHGFEPVLDDGRTTR